MRTLDLQVSGVSAGGVVGDSDDHVFAELRIFTFVFLKTAKFTRHNISLLRSIDPRENKGGKLSAQKIAGDLN